VLGEATADGQLTVTDAHFGNKPVDMDDGSAARQAAEDDARRVAPAARLRRRPSMSPAIDLKDAACACCAAGRGLKTFLITIGDRSRRRHDRARPDGRPVAGAGGRRRRDHADVLIRVISAKPSPWASARRWRCSTRRPRPHGHRRGADQPRRRRHRRLGKVKLSANWMAAAGPGEDAALFDTVKAVVSRVLPGARLSIPVGKDSLSMRTPGKRDKARRSRWCRRCR
jgi:phosphoribosylformylglycinamidine synthase